MESFTLHPITFFTLLLLLGIFIIAFFVCMIYRQKRHFKNEVDAYLQERSERDDLLTSNIDLQETERKRLAADLHDGVGALLSATKLNLNMLKNEHSHKSELVHSIDETKKIIDQTMDAVRRISRELLPASLEKFGLGQALDDLCHKLTTVTTEVTYEEKGESYVINKRQTLLIFRVAQEVINNAARQGGKRVIDVLLKWADPLVLTVTANADTSDQTQYNESITQSPSIEKRVNLLGGRLEVNFYQCSTSVQIFFNKQNLTQEDSA